MLHSVSEYIAAREVPVGAVQTPRQMGQQVHVMHGGQLARGYGVAACRDCRGPVMIWFECLLEQLHSIRNSANALEWSFTGNPPKILGTYPQPTEPDDSPHYPEKLRAVFVELQEDIACKRTPARIVVGCRSVMEVALTGLGFDKGLLLTRIDKAREQGLLTEGMRQWAHKVRLAGNEAAHELEANTDEARELVDFIRLFLEVVFVLPERIQKAAHH